MNDDHFNNPNRKARILKASRLLSSKVGSGEVDEKSIAHAQMTIDTYKPDFVPLAKEHLEKLRKAIDECDITAEGFNHKAALNKFSEPVMLLKGNAAMFNYELVGNLANVMLNFLETIKIVDEHVMEIMEVHHQSLSRIIKERMEGEGGDAGVRMMQELKMACKRYFAKHSIPLEPSIGNPFAEK